jgi:DNA-binding protein Fis
MLDLEKQIQTLRENFEFSQRPVLSVYADINPARPENAGRAWVKRVKNALKDLPEIRDVNGKRDTSLYEEVLALVEVERPRARTLALFATRNESGRLLLERLDLQVDLPVVDLAHGRVDARYGVPYLTPLLFAVDEYERAGVLHFESAKWRFYGVFLGEFKEDMEIFAEINPDEWKEIKELSQKIGKVYGDRAAKPGGRFDKLSPEERANAKVAVYCQRLYSRLSRLLDKAIDRLAIERLVLMGEPWQVSHFESFLSRGTRNRVVARVPHPKNPTSPSVVDLRERVFPALEAAERAAENKLLDRIREQPGVWGLDPVLDALQLGRVEVLVLPWALDAKIWRCEKEGFVAATEETAKIFCDSPVQVALRDYVWALAGDYGARLEFLRGEPEQRLMKEFGGAAALLRW